MNSLLNNLQTKFLGRQNFYFETIDSTQSEIWRRINKQKIKNGTIIIANIQTDGRGTHGRVWHTNEGDNIAFSIYTETNNSKIQNFEGITIEIADIFVEIFKDKYNLDIEIKFPNDLMIKNKKIGGILTESKINSDILKYLVIGIGINTNKMKFSDDIKDIASSIMKEYGIRINSFEIISEFCNRFERILNERINNEI